MNKEFNIGDMLEARNSGTYEKWGFIILLGEEWKEHSFYLNVWSQRQGKIAVFDFSTINKYFKKVN